MKKRLLVYPVSVLALALLTTLAVGLRVPQRLARVYPEWRARRALQAKAQDVANFVECVDKSTDWFVILDAAFGNDGRGVAISGYAPRPIPEKFPERAAPTYTEPIAARRLARHHERGREAWQAVLGCALQEVPWMGYLRITFVSLTFHYDLYHGTTGPSAAAEVQLIIRSRRDMTAIRDAFNESPEAGSELIGEWIQEEHISMADYSVLRQIFGRATEVQAGQWRFPDMQARIKRIAEVETRQDVEETP